MRQHIYTPQTENWISMAPSMSFENRKYVCVNCKGLQLLPITAIEKLSSYLTYNKIQAVLVNN